ncbi:D-alanine--D-alanine ligase [Candidatus Hepatobacter penaei]|uniref:D-alanine--D-alanine ligase n=1 Tax=Candidatus Hepatobacter penaei TaxID=1274402 RepID=UPI00069815EA|nr:D-alanine--D-alanine ligase [Candidatus Hepatobacter penaei]
MSQPLTPPRTIAKAVLDRSFRVLVLQGGWSSEREVSLASGKGVQTALRNLGHEVEALDPPRHVRAILEGIEQSFGGRGPEIIFNILHGLEVEDGTLQGVLTLVGIPYTFSGVSASVVAMHKGLSRLLMQEVGVMCPPGRTLSLDDYAACDWPYPHVVKPLGEGSSVGVFLVEKAQDKQNVVSSWSFGPQVLVEDYIPGREIQVAVFAGQAMGAVELCFPGPIFDYEAKYTAGMTQHIIPPDVPTEVLEVMYAWAERAHHTLGCRGITRTDFRYNPEAAVGYQVFFLETNTQPGFTDISLVPDIARVYGWSYEEVITFLLDQALRA